VSHSLPRSVDAGAPRGRCNLGQTSPRIVELFFLRAAADLANWTVFILIRGLAVMARVNANRRGSL